MKLALILKTVQFEYSLFALPFAGVGALLAANGMPKFTDLFWIALAVLGARNAAVGINRLVDKEIDLNNPRTKDWLIPQGIVTSQEMIIFILVALGIFFLATLQLHPVCLYFLPLVVFILFIYSYLKRFSCFCHLGLGLALAWAPWGAWLAIKGTIAWAPFFLGLGVMFWIAGFDTIYACLDLKFDRLFGLHSIPARLGITAGLLFPIFFHFLAIFFFLLVGYLSQLGIYYYLGIIFSSFLLIYQHTLVSYKDLSKINAKFFSLNKIISSLIFIFTLLDFLTR